MKNHLLLRLSGPVAALSLSASAAADVIFSSGFNANTGAVVLAGNTDNTSGSSTVEITDWTTDESVTSISGLTAISTGNSGTLGGFAQLQNGTATYANPDVIYLSRNLNLDTDRTSTRRGFSFTFTLASPVTLGQLTVYSGHTNNTGMQDQTYSSDLIYALEGGTLAAPLGGSTSVDYGMAPALREVPFVMPAETLGAGTYTLSVYQSNMTAAGAYAVFDGIRLDSAASAPLRVIAAGFQDGAYQITVSGLDTAKSYLLKRSETLADGFPTQIGAPLNPAADTAVFTDPAPAGTRGFYRVEEAP